MYCRKCLKKSTGQKKVSMTTNIEGKCYVCPSCETVIRWHKEKKISFF